MKKLSACCLTLIFISFAFTPAEKRVAAPGIIFAVLNDGGLVEPVAKVEDGKLVQTVSGSDDAAVLKEFSDLYYKPKTTYTLIVGGKDNGKVSVVQTNLDSDCGATTAQVTTASPKLRLKGFDRALATNTKATNPYAGVRKAPTTAEKAAIEKLVVKAFQQNKVAVKGLKMVKLTSIDADNDKVNEIVGSYTVSPSANQRGLLFFIATKTKTGSYSINYSECRKIMKDEVMSGDIKDVDDGIYQELLLDIFDFDNNGKAEIFTMTQSFEGAGFYAYQLNGGKWEQVLDASTYHCGY